MEVVCIDLRERKGEVGRSGGAHCCRSHGIPAVQTGRPFLISNVQIAKKSLSGEVFSYQGGRQLTQRLQLGGCWLT
jgi:hypothetical protein